MRPKPPKTVDLGPMTIPIVFDKQATMAASANGNFMPDLSTILLSPDNSLDVERDTVLHELLHAVWNQTFLVYKYPDKSEDSEGELIIAEIATKVLELLRRNPKLVAYLVGE